MVAARSFDGPESDGPESDGPDGGGSDAGGPGPPRVVRAAAAMVAVQGAAGAVVVVILLLRAVTSPVGLGTVVATGVWFAICAAALLGMGITLWRGAHGARSPAVVAQLLLLGVAWYAAGPSSQPEYGIPAAVYCAVVLVLLFSAPAIRWNYGGDISDRRQAG